MHETMGLRGTLGLCILGNQANPYTHDLLVFQRAVPSIDYVIPSLLSHVQTPLNVPVWEAKLASHPDRLFAEYVMNGLSSGFRVGYDYSRPHLSAKSNMKSAGDHSP